MNASTEGVLLGVTPYRDADIIARLYSRDLGQLSAVARSARKSRRRFGGALSLACVSRFELRRRGEGELWSMDSATLQLDFTSIAQDIIATAHASYGVELVRELTAVEQPEPAIFDALVELFTGLSEAGPSSAMLRAFELRLLELVGLAPAVGVCAACAGEIGGGSGFSARAGGFVCQRCRTRLGAGEAIPEGTLDYVAALSTVSSIAGAVDIAAHGNVAAAVRKFLSEVILAEVGKPLKSVQFLMSLRRKPSVSRP